MGWDSFHNSHFQYATLQTHAVAVSEPEKRCQRRHYTNYYSSRTRREIERFPLKYEAVQLFVILIIMRMFVEQQISILNDL